MSLLNLSVILVHAGLLALLTLAPTETPPIPVATEKVVVHTVIFTQQEVVEKPAPQEIVAATNKPPAPPDPQPSKMIVPPITVPSIQTPGSPAKKPAPVKKPAKLIPIAPKAPAPEIKIPNAIKPVAPSPPAKKTPPAGITKEQMKLLLAARDKLASVQKRVPQLQIESGGGTSYENELVRTLKNELILPEYGAVKVKITVTRSGAISKVQILSTESEKNKNGVEKALKNIHLPAFGANFSGETEHTFVIVLKNDT